MSLNNIISVDFSAYFGTYNGCMALYDLQTDIYTVYNADQCDIKHSPDSTYKIVSALAGLEYGVISENNTTLKWSGKNYTNKSWNKDQTLFSAIQNSVNWYFQSIDSIVGKERLKTILCKFKYGNCDLSADVRSFWADSSLKISAFQQIEFLKSFYLNSLDFSSSYIELIKRSIFLMKNERTILSGKTGTEFAKGVETNGWFIGYITSNKNVIFFSTYIDQNSPSNGKMAFKIAINILNERGYL